MRTYTTTLKYIISLSLALSSLLTLAQDEVVKLPPFKGPERTLFIRAGVDLSRFALPYLMGYDYAGAEAFIDAELAYKFFPTIEGGFTRVADNNSSFQYESDGYYGRVGLNYNLLKYKHRLDRNLFFIGFRYGYSQFQHAFSNVNISTDFGSSSIDIPAADMQAHWVEGVIGVRGEIVQNLFMGITVRTKIRLATQNFGNFTPYIIPGYGEGHKRTSAGISYTISYAFPIKKVIITE